MDSDVIILAGGLGTRLRPVVREVPKCMASVAGRPFIAWLLDWLRPSGPCRVVLSVGYLRKAVEDWVTANASVYPFEFVFSEEEEPLGTGGGIRLALERCSSDKVLILNGDTFFNVDLPSFMESASGPVSVALKPMRDFDRYGEVVTDGIRITSFREKAFCAEGLINGGVYYVDRVFLRSVMSSLPERFSFEKEVLEPLAGSPEAGLSGVVSDCYFIDIGVPEDYVRASDELPQVAEMMSVAGKAAAYRNVFLDRDGVINRQMVGDYVRRWVDFEFRPGIFDLISRLSGCRILVVTNQRGVGRGVMSEEDLLSIHRRMVGEIEAHGGRIDAVYSCTSADKDDPCRKPGKGMFLRAMEQYPEIVPEGSVMIGDGDVDRDFAAACGMDFIRVSPFRNDI